MQNINEILARAAALRDETQLNSISPERAGSIMYDTLLALNDLWLQQGAALVISKIYASVAAMEADTAPVSDLTGQPLRPGQIVVIASEDSDNGSVYRYNGTESPSWSLVGEIGNLEPVDSLDSDSTQLPLAAHQGKVLDGKISQLGQQVIYDSMLADEVLNSKTLSVTGSGIVPYCLKKGVKYTFENIGDVACNVFTSDGETGITRINEGTFEPRNSFDYIPSDTTYFIRIVGFAAGVEPTVKISMHSELYDDFHTFEDKYNIDAKELIYESVEKTVVRVGTIPYIFKAGVKYLITNNCSYALSVYSNDGSSNIERVGTTAFAANETREFVPSSDADYVRIVQADPGEDFWPLSIIIKSGLSNYALEKSIRDISNRLNSEAEIFTGTYASFPCPFIKGQGYIIKNVGDILARVYTSDGTDNLEELPRRIAPNDYLLFFPSVDATHIKLAGVADEKSVAVIQTPLTKDSYSVINSARNQKPLVQLKYDYTPQDLSADLDNGVIPIYKMNQGNEYSLFPDILIAKYDALVSAHSGEIVKVDLGELCDIAYPEYANLNGVASGNYLATPSYKMWMYKIESTSHATEFYYTKKKKLLITGGIHGWEMMGTYGAYRVIKKLLDEYLTDESMFKLRAAFDIYIIPLVNGYGNYHLTRQNANGVNLNRNFYIGASHTELQPFDFDYPGETGLSEFESQVIAAVANIIQPDLVIDCHTNGGYPFYTDFFYTDFFRNLLNASYQSLVDVSIFAKKTYPTYFGSQFDVLLNEMAPTDCSHLKGTLAGWFNTDNVTKQLPFTAIVETSQAVNYNNGQYIEGGEGHGILSCGIEAATIAEYVIRNQILRYCEFVMNDLL